MKITNEKLRRAIEILDAQTIVKLLETQGFNLEPPKPKFKKIILHQFIVAVRDNPGDHTFPILIGFNAEFPGGSAEMQYPYTSKSLVGVREIIAALHSAIDFVVVNRTFEDQLNKACDKAEEEIGK